MPHISRKYRANLLSCLLAYKSYENTVVITKMLIEYYESTDNVQKLKFNVILISITKNTFIDLFKFTQKTLVNITYRVQIDIQIIGSLLFLPSLYHD